MRRRLLAWPILCVLMLVEACTGDQHAMPTEVTPSATDAAAAAAIPGCPTPRAVDRQIIALVPQSGQHEHGGDEVGDHRDADHGRIIAVVDFDLIVILFRLGEKTEAQQAMFQLWSKVLHAYFANKLNGGMSAATQAAVLALGKAFYCNVGLDGSGLTLGTNPLDPNNAVAVVFPSTTTQTVVTGNGNSGVMIPPTALTAPATITITLIPGTFAEFTGPLQTKLDQFGPYFQYTASPEGSIVDSVIVALCTSDAQLPASRVHLAHNVGTGLEILPLVPSFLTGCPVNTIGSAQQRSPFELVQAHDYRGAVSAVGSMIGSLFVTDAHAGGTIGIGGKTKSFSPFGLVDTTVVEVPNSATNQQARTGSPVASRPSVVVRTHGNGTPIPGAQVVFFVTQGGGTLTDATRPQPPTEDTVVTGANGTASVGSWTVGVGTNLVTAQATFPSLTGVGVSVACCVIDTAFGGDVIHYRDSAYKFLLASTGDTVNFFLRSFNDATWATGNAAFGGPFGSNFCPLDNTVATTWDNSNPPSAFLLRKTFLWPAKGNGMTSLRLGVAIDNDIQVYVNGIDVTSSVISNTPGDTLTISGYVDHDGCASRDSIFFSVSDSLLVAGSNLLAVRARDRGGIAYVDVRLSAPTLMAGDRITTPIRAGSKKSGGASKLAPPTAPAPRVRLKQ